MEFIESTSRLCVLFTVMWQRDGVIHREKFYGDKVNMWRDLLPGMLKTDLLGKQVGERVQVHVKSDEFFQPYQENLRRTVTPAQFLPLLASNGDSVVEPVLGRYYPQSFLTGVPGVFRVSKAPCRYLAKSGQNMVFDLNHPLADNDLTVSAKVLSISNGIDERGGRCEDWLEAICADGPGMQSPLPGAGSLYFEPRSLSRIDERDDGLFYGSTRLVQHLDSTAREQISSGYRRILPADGAILDCMASWDSHLGNDFSASTLTALGMNRQELEQNGKADTIVVHDLNKSPQLPFADESFDGVVCTASIEYLKDPLTVCRELARVLRRSGRVAITFSNRWFPTKAVSIWSELHEFERLGMVLQMIQSTGEFEGLETLSIRNFPRPENDTYSHLPHADPVYMVTARKGKMESG